MTQLVARRRLEHVRPATQQFDPLACLTRLLEDPFQAVERRLRRVTLTVEQAAIGSHGCREIVQSVFF